MHIEEQQEQKIEAKYTYSHSEIEIDDEIQRTESVRQRNFFPFDTHKRVIKTKIYTDTLQHKFPKTRICTESEMTSHTKLVANCRINSENSVNTE